MALNHISNNNKINGAYCQTWEKEGDYVKN